MNNQPREKLCELVRTHGRRLCEEPEKCAALLAEACPGHSSEVDILVVCLKHGASADMLNWPRGRSGALLSVKLVRRLVDEASLNEESARWAVESWLLAMGQTGDSTTSGGEEEVMTASVEEPAETDVATSRGTLPVPPEFFQHPDQIRLGRERGASAGTMIGVILGILIMLVGQAAEWSTALSLGWALVAPLLGALSGAIAGRVIGPLHSELAAAVAGAVVGLFGGTLLHGLAASEEITEVWHQALITGLIGSVVGVVTGALQRGVIHSLAQLLAGRKQKPNRSSR